MDPDLKNIANFLFEAGVLQKTPRSFYTFLGSGQQSVAEHANRTALIGYALGKQDGKVDVNKIVLMCLFHDFGEARVSDLNYVNQKYAERDEQRAIKDLCAKLPFGQDVEQLWAEHQAKQTPEAVYVKDADNLEFILSLKEEHDIGNKRAMEWMDSAVKRLKTILAKELAAVILQTDSTEWWLGDKKDEWWVSRQKKLAT